jgi:hypothetical protein
MTKSQVTGVNDARKGGNLDSLALWKLAGAEANETTVLAPGPALTVTLEMALREARTTRTTTFIVRPYASDALAVWQRTRDDDQDSG